MRKVITYGTFDLFHEGHYNLLKRAKALGDYLIVGVTTDTFDLERGKINTCNNVMERIDAVRATGLADLIVIEEYKGQKIDDILKYGVEIFAIGSDWEGYFDYLNEFCKVVYLPRTEGISSTQIRKHRPVADIGIIGTGSIASRFASESAFVNSARITGAYNPLKSECDDFCKSSTFRQARILSKSCFKSATLSTSPRLTTLILIMPKRRCAQGNTSSAKPRLSQAERKPRNYTTWRRRRG